MRAVSRKRAALLRVRGKIVRRSEPQACEWCHREPAVDTHELVNRSQLGSAAINLDLMVPIGRACHDWATTHPHEAALRGMTIPYWQHALASYAQVVERVPYDAMKTAARTPITVKFDADALDWIDQQARLRNVDRSELLRRIVDATRRLQAGLPPPITNALPTTQASPERDGRRASPDGAQ